MDKTTKKINIIAITFVSLILISALGLILTSDLEDFVIHYGEIAEKDAKIFVQKGSIVLNILEQENHLKRNENQHTNRKTLKKNTELHFKTQNINNDKDIENLVNNEQLYDKYMNNLYKYFEEIDEQGNSKITKQNFAQKLNKLPLENQEELQILYQLADMNENGFIGIKEWENFKNILRDCLKEQYGTLQTPKEKYKLLDNHEQTELSNNSQNYMYYQHY
ncbi:hypothetical protein PPERSA_02395 [Pseudocohnilembus persalinus]|uniref:EF-hand domain-containing protein n=1 Tax=Pseudocohnilembus persalinus TaxID=266149 RepID=A0A0V0QBJ7_PSEPJ|nr:hypothetical protein PPERSA_02395 [Pseudocohnilembus persalinus]|eukprot:KRW99537.1 hypothetical protein PPERSA_02395 [Pseudocohnilembus persalinus]